MDVDTAYANADFIPGAADYPARWAQAAAEARALWVAEGRARLDLSYGTGGRQRFDLFLPVAAPHGLIVFVHGGYWRAFNRTDWSHLARGGLGRGWAVAMPSYSLAPAARVAAITHEVRDAIVAAAAEIAGPVVLTGHSAGGHLAARMNCSDIDLPTALATRIAHILPISPVADLRPLLHAHLNADLRIDPAEAAAESPRLHRARRGISTTVWVGAEERPAFLDQAGWLAEAWDEARLHIAPGRHHFDVIDDLADPGSSLVDTLLDPA